MFVDDWLARVTFRHVTTECMARWEVSKTNMAAVLSFRLYLMAFRRLHFETLCLFQFVYLKNSLRFRAARPVRLAYLSLFDWWAGVIVWIIATKVCWIFLLNRLIVTINLLIVHFLVKIWVSRNDRQTPRLNIWYCEVRSLFLHLADLWNEWDLLALVQDQLRAFRGVIRAKSISVDWLGIPKVVNL